MSRKYDPEKTIRNRGEVSLRKYIFIPFALLFSTTVVFICWFSYYSAQKSIREFQIAIAEEVSRGVSLQLSRFFSITSSVVKVNADFIRVGRLNTDDNEEMQRHFMSQMNNLKHLSFIGFGSADGGVLSVTREMEGGRLMVLSSSAADGWKLNVSDITEGYDVLPAVHSGIRLNGAERPWYKFAVEKGSAGWYPVYKYIPYDGYGIGVSSPVYSLKDGRLLGVLVADMSLSRVSEYLKSIKMSGHGFVFITDPQGNMVGSTLNESAYVHEHGGSVRCTMHTFPDKRLRIISDVSGFQAEDDVSRFIEIDNESYLVNKSRYTDPFGLKMDIWTVVAQDDYNQQFQNNLRIAIMVVLTAAVLGWFVIIKISDYLSRPILELSRHAQEISAGNLNRTVSDKSNVVEIKQLSRSFNIMAEELSGAFAALEKGIEERTEELNIANKKLIELTITDDLTKVSNRRHFNDVMAREWSHSSRSGAPLTLLMIDIDFFKNYNDNYGHQAGDECLRRVAGVIRDNVKRVTDLAARYGGEEFAVIMPNTLAEKAPVVAERIRKAVEECRLVHEKSSFGVVTVSVGYATVVADDKSTADDLIRMADTALYAAKTSGRNKIFG